MIERWKAVHGFEGRYEISDRGRVRSLINDVVMKAKPNSKYPEVKLRRNGQSIMKYVHIAVLEAFVGPCPDGMECRHLDGDRRNNQISNLAWGTLAQNRWDLVRHGTLSKGSKHWASIAGSVKRTSDGRFAALT